MSFVVEIHDPYSEHPHLTDERVEHLTVEIAAGHFEDLTGIEYEIARDDLSRGEKLTYESDGRVVTAVRVEHVGAAS